MLNAYPQGEDMSDMAFNSAIELAQLIKRREIGCVELLDYYLERVRRYNPQLNAIVVLDEARARARAQEADAALARNEDWGALHGVPMTCKESYHVAGLPTTFGNPAFQDNIATTDALAIERLKAAGAVIFGKTNVPLHLADFQSYNEIYGTTNNPWDLGRIPGGSSGGSAAALAAGLTGFEIGSDIGGSIRNPSHFCGIFGHKPTWGILPPRGHALTDTLAPSDLSVIGPLGRRAADLELGVQIMAGPDEIDRAGYQLNLKAPAHTSLATYRVAMWQTDTAAPVSQDIMAHVEAVAQAVMDAGGEVHETARPHLDPEAARDAYQTLLQAVMSSRAPDDAYARLQREAAALVPDDRSERAMNLRRQVSTYRDYAMAHETRTQLCWAWHAFFQSYDVLIAPVMATSAFAHDHQPFHERSIVVAGQAQPYFQQIFWAGLASCAYLPATVIPTGPDAAGLPIGVQVIGPAYGDLTTIGFAKLLEEAGFAFVAPPGY
jgi:amidase